MTPKRQQQTGRALANGLSFRLTLQIDHEGKVWQDGKFLGWVREAEITPRIAIHREWDETVMRFTIQVSPYPNGAVFRLDGSPLDEDTLEVIERPADLEQDETADLGGGAR